MKIKASIFRHIFKKILPFLASFLMLFQSLAPAGIVYAQAASSPTPDPSPIVETTPSPTPGVSPSPTVEPTPSLAPSVSPSPTPESSAGPTPSPTIEPSPSPTVVPSPTSSPEVSSSPSPTTGGTLEGEILQNTSANSVKTLIQRGDLTASQIQNSDPTVVTDKADYAPTDAALITGTNFSANATYTIHITSVNSYTFDASVTTNSEGSFAYVYQLDGTYRPTYEVQIKDGNGTVVATTSFTDANPSANLDQCANDPAPSPSIDGCSTSASDWVNGNLGASKSSYFEGDSIPYRLTFDNLSLAPHNVTIEWDTTKSDKHAIDYLTTFSRTVATANPCLGVSGCSSSTTFAIPVDPQVTGAGVTPVAGNFTLYGGTITAVSAYTYANGTGFAGDKSARITITFTASQVNPVLAWGGHIATRANWGATMAATAIPGSPYHTRLIDLDGSGGNQDRSLSADAVIFPGSITIIKDATPNGSTSFPFTAFPSPLTGFSLVDDGTSANTHVFSNITNFQTYSINEIPVPVGWGFDSASCSVTSANGGTQTVSGSTATIVLKEGENVSCTYTNHLLAGTLIVKKHVVNDNGGAATASNFTLHVKSSGTDIAGSPQAGSETGTNYTLNGGTYVVSENTPPTGYTQTGFSGDCDSSGNVTVVAGLTKTCTITNNDNAPVLHLRKTVTNDNGGKTAITDWTLTANGALGSPTNLSGTTPVDSGSNFKADTYALAESGGPSGYLAGAWDCGAATMPDATHVTVPLGENVTCTINNNDVAPILKLVKVVTNDNGGTKTSHDWTLTATGSGGFSDAGDSTTFHSVTAGVGYVLSESVISGYDAGNWSCDTGSLSGSTITLNLAQNATCTITNNDQAPHFIIIKSVINDNGGTKVAGDFSGTISGVTVSGGNTWTGTVTPGVNKTLTSVGSYNVSENADADYDTTYSADCTGSIALGETKTCTVTNNDKAVHLIVIKHVINDNGGSAAASAFSTTITGVTTANPTAAGAESPGVDNTLTSVGSYSVDEGAHDGYAKTLSKDCSGTIALGQTKTCTITNDDISPQLTVIKHVINDNGGNNVAADFTMNVTATNPSQSSFAGSELGTTISLDAGAYSVDEGAFSGYTKSIGADCSGTIALGETKTCTITNDDIAPTITLTKVVNNNHGGNAGVNDFGLTVGGASVKSGDVKTVSSNTPIALNEAGLTGYQFVSLTGDAGCPSVLGGTATLTEGQNLQCTITNEDQSAHVVLIKSVTENNGGTAGVDDFGLTVGGSAVKSGDTTDVNSNTPIALNEAGLAGYQFVSITGAGCPASLGGTVTLNEGQTITCTINNDDIPAHLIVIKHVDNGNTGATGVASDFTTTISGVTTTVPTAAGAESPGVDNTLTTIGSYSVDESTHTGYDKTLSTDCSGTIALGETKTCTIINTAIAPQLKLVKTVINDNGGTKQVSDFPLFIDGNSVTSGDFNPVTVGSHTATETSDPGYAASAWGTDCAAGGTMSLALGESKTCTITNDDIAPKLHLRKVVVNDNGGTALATAWTLNADGTGSNDLSGTTPVDSGSGLLADTFALSETGGPTGYTASNWVCVGGTQNGSNITVGIGGEATCTITNDDQSGHLIVHKITNPADDQTVFSATLDATPLVGDATRDLSTTTDIDYEVNAGTYFVTEAAKTGWDETGNTCSEVVVANGETQECTITNTQRGKIIVTKYNDVDGKGIFNPDGQVLSGWTINLSGQDSQQTGSDGKVTFENLIPGTFQLSEDLINKGWEQTAIFCNEDVETSRGEISTDVEIFLSAGQTANCYILNHSLTPIITITKQNDATGDRSPGGSVLYTITVALDEQGGPANDVITTDLLPSGFKYRAGSWTAVSSDISRGAGGDLKAGGITTEPTYASPGTWKLGNMKPGEVVTLTLIADIDGGQKPGLYKDVAWAQGKSLGGDTVLALAQPLGLVDTNFVGTQVNITGDTQNSISYKVEKEGEVLGVTTELPATGASTYWVLFAIVGIILGSAMLIVGMKIRRKHV